MSSYTSISSGKLSRLIGTAHAPALVDVRLDEDFDADPRLIPGAVRRSHRDIDAWASQLGGKSAIVVCHKAPRQEPTPGGPNNAQHASDRDFHFGGFV